MISLNSSKLQWKENNGYAEVECENQNYISFSWVNTCKYLDGNKQMKSRPVARSFEESDPGVVTDFPACSKESLRLTFPLFAIKSWKIHSPDISSSFLQEKSIDREVYVKPPSGCC